MKLLSEVLKENEEGLREWRDEKRGDVEKDAVFQQIDGLLKHIKTYPQIFYVSLWLSNYSAMFAWNEMHTILISVRGVAINGFYADVEYITCAISDLVSESKSEEGLIKKEDVIDALDYFLEGDGSAHEDYTKYAIEAIDNMIRGVHNRKENQNGNYISCRQ